MLALASPWVPLLTKGGIIFRSVLGHHRHHVRILLTGFILCLLPTMITLVSTSKASPEKRNGKQMSTELWPRFLTPNKVFVANVKGMSNGDLVTATTLQGIYNAKQEASRLYLSWRPEDGFWTTQIPQSIHVVDISPPDDETMLALLLKRFRSAVKGAIVTDPSNPDTVNLATTMAGLDRAIVINPSQKALAASLGIKILYNFDTSEFTNDDAVQTYQWGIHYLLPQTSTRILTWLPGTHGGDRDYAVATRSFVFNLTAHASAEKKMIATILAHTADNTPVMGYVPNENQDVAFLSAHGHFLFASDNFSNGSVWASIPIPSSVQESTKPSPIRVQPNTVYVAFLVSDGDNSQYIEHRMTQVWHMSNLGAVPEGWTFAPGMLYFAPTMMRYFNNNLPRNSELDAGGSGIGYVSRMSGAPLSQFGKLTREIMQQEDMKSAYMIEPPTDLKAFAQSCGLPGIVERDPLSETKVGGTIAIGESSGYLKTAHTLFCSLHQQSNTKKIGKPLFLAPQVDAWTLTPTDVLHVAQQLTLAGQRAGYQYVFTTPTELALTMKRYYNNQESGLPLSNNQSMTGAQTLQEPIVGPHYRTQPVDVIGSNLVTNPNGASGTSGWSWKSGSMKEAKYDGGPALHWTSSFRAGESWVQYNIRTGPTLRKRHTYTFSVDVAGSGQVFEDIFAAGDSTTLPVNLTSTYQHLTWTLTVPENASSVSLQVRESGAGPVSVYIKNASIAESTSPCPTKGS